MPVRIMHVVDTLGKGGLENGLVNLIERLDPARFEHVVCAIRGLGANADRLPRERVRVMCMGKTPSGSRFQAGDLMRAIREVSPDVVHSRNWPAIEAVLAARLLGRASVHSEHGIETDAKVKQPWRRTCFRRLAFGLANRVVSVSRQLGDMHARDTGYSRNKITVIHNGVDCERFRPDAAVRGRVRRELGLADEELCLGCVGNLLPVKDHLTLLRALDGLDAVTTRWRLLIAGEGTERPKLEAFLETQGEWRHRVHFLGLSNSVAGLLQAMDLFVLPSLFEGISNALLEAMATGLPVAVTATGGNPEVVVDGESGLLFPGQDAQALSSHLARLATDRDLRVRLGAQAVRRVREEFSMDSMVRQYGQLYESTRPRAARPYEALAGA
jgi:sugar transferase (PEP-CTERM/EpsH1 system associated)